MTMYLHPAFLASSMPRYAVGWGYIDQAMLDPHCRCTFVSAFGSDPVLPPKSRMPASISAKAHCAPPHDTFGVPNRAATRQNTGRCSFGSPEWNVTEGAP